jgi:hypothetical protein
MNPNRPEHCETKAIRTYLTDVDKAACDTLRERYGDIVPPERMRAMEEAPSQFDSPREFHKAFRSETGERADAGVVGFTKSGTSAHISTKSLESVPGTVLHERLHQLSDPKAEKILGHDLYEGMTEDLALKSLGREPEVGDPIAYPADRARAHELRKAVGSEIVDRAYFQGDAEPLRRALDEKLRHVQREQVQSRIKGLEPLET